MGCGGLIQIQFGELNTFRKSVAKKHFYKRSNLEKSTSVTDMAKIHFLEKSVAKIHFLEKSVAKIIFIILIYFL